MSTSQFPKASTTETKRSDASFHPFKRLPDKLFREKGFDILQTLCIHRLGYTAYCLCSARFRLVYCEAINQTYWHVRHNALRVMGQFYCWAYIDTVLCTYVNFFYPLDVWIQRRLFIFQLKWRDAICWTLLESTVSISRAKTLKKVMWMTAIIQLSLRQFLQIAALKKKTSVSEATFTHFDLKQFSRFYSVPTCCFLLLSLMSTQRRQIHPWYQHWCCHGNGDSDLDPSFPFSSCAQLSL